MEQRRVSRMIGEINVGINSGFYRVAYRRHHEKATEIGGGKNLNF